MISTNGTRRADALACIVEHFLAKPPDRTPAAAASDRYCVMVQIDQSLLSAGRPAPPSLAGRQRCEIEAMPQLAVETARRLACDGARVGMSMGANSEPLDVGRRMRSVPPSIDRALRARVGGCTFSGCGRTRGTHAHHIVHWADGGETKLGNLTVLCRFHHRLVHEGGFEC